MGEQERRNDALGMACEEARELGREAGRASGSWAADGNTSEEHARRMLRMAEEGDPAFYDFCPAPPSLSGEWADDLTSSGLAERCGYSESCEEEADALALAWEEGAGETHEQACIAAYRAVLGLGEEETEYPCPGCGEFVTVHVMSNAANASSKPLCEECEQRAHEAEAEEARAEEEAVPQERTFSQPAFLTVRARSMGEAAELLRAVDGSLVGEGVELSLDGYPEPNEWEAER